MVEQRNGGSTAEISLDGRPRVVWQSKVGGWRIDEVFIENGRVAQLRVFRYGTLRWMHFWSDKSKEWLTSIPPNKVPYLRKGQPVTREVGAQLKRLHPQFVIRAKMLGFL